LIIGSCAEKKPADTTLLGMWTDYTLIPARLNGKVKEVTELNYWAVEKDGKMTRGDLMTRKDLDSVGSTKNLKAYFDMTGNLTKYEVLNKEDVFQTITPTMENRKWTRCDYKQGDSLIYYVITQCDDLGYIVTATRYRPLVDTIINKYVLTNDGKNYYTKFEYFNYKNQRTGYQECTLDEKGNVLETKFYNKADSLALTMKNFYDEKYNIIRQETTAENPKGFSTWVYKDLKTDDHGNWIESLADIDNGKYKIFAERIYVYY